MRKIYTRVLVCCLSLLLVHSLSAQVRISQVYGGGGNSGSTYKNDFIEIFNAGTSAVNLAGWSVQYASSAGTSWAVTTLSGTLQPGHYYLIQEAAGGGGTTDLPTPDATGNINMSATAGKVALVNSTTALTGSCPTAVDLIGFGTAANCFEGATTSNLSATAAAIRINNGCTDTNNNATDFSVAVPNPRNTASPANICGFVCTPPANQPTSLSFTPAITSIDGSFTGATGADSYLVLMSTSASLSQQPASGTAYTTGTTFGNAQVVSTSNSTTFNVSSLTAATTYYFFVYANSSTNCYNTTSPLTGSIATQPNPAPTVSVAAGFNAAEPAANGTFVLTLSAPAPAGGVTVTYSLGGTAIAGTDYSDSQNGSITIAQGASSGTITLNTIDDNNAEPLKTISINILSVNNGYVVTTGTASINLTDEDVAAGIPLVNTYSQNFNTLASTGTAITWTDNSTIPGWYSSRVVYNSGNGGSNAGALYSFGTTGSTDRALGSVGSGSTGTVFYGARFKNNTGTTITSLKITYTGEQWRNGGVASVQTVNFAYQTGSILTSLSNGVWAPVTNLNFSSLVNTTTAAALDGNLVGTNAAIITYTINGLSIAPNEEIMIRWEDIDHSGADHGLGIDDFTIEANPADLAAPVVTALFPANGAIDVPTNVTASITFDETVQKGTGTITIKRSSDNSTVQSFDINDAAITLSTTTLSIPLVNLQANTGFYIEVSAGAVKDPTGNDFAGISGNSSFAFTTGNVFYAANFNSCGSVLSDGFSQYSTTGSVVWACTTFGRDPSAPAGSAAFPSGVQINGFSGGTNTPNVDWLISPSFNLTNTTFPLLSFWSRTAFNGLPLQLKVSTDYTGGDPALATWTDINGKFPQQTSNIWTLSQDINLTAFKAANVHFAFVYTSSDDDGARWTIDDVSIANSVTPPPPSLTVGTTDISYTYVANGATAEKTFTFIGNDLTSDVTLTATGNFQLSKNGMVYTSSITYTQAEANNVNKTVYVRFAPTQQGQNFTGTVTVATGSLSSVVNLKGTSIDPATTLEVVNWNLEWFGSPVMDPKNDDQQEQNIKTILQNIGADVYGLVEVVDEARLANIVNQMPGYSYVICNYGSHTNPFESNPGPLSLAQKAAFVYKTNLFSNITTTALLSQGVNTAADLSNDQFNAWSSGRYPFMMSADVTLNCVTKNVKFVLVHAKANTSPTNVSYDRRKAGADSLHSYLNKIYPNDNIVILGDFNDDLDQSITAGFTTTSWNSFTNDTENFSALTLPLSLAGKKSTVSYNDIIDHVVVSNEMAPYYMESTATILNDVAGLVSNYGSTTTDHYPVFTRYRFASPLAPVITNCPVVAAQCVSTSGNYTVPVLTATDDCGAITYSYTITGATTRSGNTNDASGAFNEGTSTINWTVKDVEGNVSTCTTTVVVNENPQVAIPDAFALSSGTLPNTVYIGYTLAGSITLAPVATEGTPGYTYSWSTGSTATNVTVSPTVPTTYTVTVKDANGCMASASASIAVKDIRGKNNKVIICHKPTGTNNTLEVSAGDVANHLGHGDMLGSCTPTPQYPNLVVSASPNPSVNYFNINVRGGNPNKPVTLKVYNILGKVMETRTTQSGQQVRLGDNYRAGLYFIELSQDKDKTATILLKLR